MDPSNRSRVTCRRDHVLNQFLVKFLGEFCAQERAKNDGSTMQFTFKNALESLKKYPLELRSLDELKELKFFGNVVVRRLERRLAEYQRLHGDLDLEQLEKSATKKRTAPQKKPANVELDKPSTSAASSCQKTHGGSGRDYVPKAGSGAFAVLVALYGSEESHGLTLDQLQKRAEKFSTEPMTRPSAGQHYTPFSCLKQLEAKGLIASRKQNRLKVVSLTDTGLQLARKLVASVETSSTNLLAKRPFDDEPPDILPEKQARTCQELPPPDGYVYLTSDLVETCQKSEANHETDPELGVKMVWVKSTEKFLVSKSDMLFKLKPEHASLFPSPFVFASIYEHDAAPVAPGFGCQMKHQASNFTKIKHPLCDDEKSELVLLVDTAEVKGGEKSKGCKRALLLDYFTQSGVKFDVRKLNVGDYLWILKTSSRQELVLDVVVERKRIDDLASSIKDG